MLKLMGLLNIVLLVVFFFLLGSLYFKEMQDHEISRLSKLGVLLLCIILANTGTIYFSLN